MLVGLLIAICKEKFKDFSKSTAKKIKTCVVLYCDFTATWDTIWGVYFVPEVY